MRSLSLFGFYYNGWGLVPGRYSAPATLAQINAPSNVLAIYDMINESNGGDLNEGWYMGWATDPIYATYVNLPHNEGMTHVFADGHAKWYRIKGNASILAAYDNDGDGVWCHTILEYGISSNINYNP